VCGLAAVLKSKTPVIRNSTKLEAIDSSLEKIISRSLRAAPTTESPLLAWPLACGSAVAERTRAMEFNKGVLSVEVADTGWRAELQRLAPQYLAVINRYTGRSVNRIEFVVRPTVQMEEVRIQK
jgi:predicted nucleic acid-binding Zn ribbon protein